MLSTHSHKSERAFVFVPNLLALLQERGKTQQELATKTGLSKERISRLAHQQVVHKIVAETALKVCLALSHWARLKDKRKVAIRLDALFPMKLRRKAKRTK